jgi:hypothetical protein
VRGWEWCAVGVMVRGASGAGMGVVRGGSGAGDHLFLSVLGNMPCM